MKTKYILFFVLLLVLIISIISIIIFTKNKSNNNISNIKHFSFSYTVGYAMNARVRYEIDYDNNEYKTSIIPNGIPDEDKLEIKINKEVIDRIEQVLNKYNISKWNGFDKVDKNVLDGDSFSLYLRMQNDKTIEASGYMKWPDNYGKVRSELDSIFMEIYNKNGGKKSE